MPLTDEQVINWRKILSMQIGPLAYALSREEIEAFRDELQKAVDEEKMEEKGGI